MVLLLRFFKNYIAKSTVYDNPNVSIRSTEVLLKLRKSFNFLTQLELAKIVSCTDLGKRIYRELGYSKLSFETKPNEEATFLPHFEIMKSFSKKLLGIMPKFKRKKKSSRDKKSLKKVMKSSLTGNCSQFSTTVRSSDHNEPSSTASTSESSPNTMALNYRDALVNWNTSLLNAKGDIDLKTIYKNIRHTVETPYGRWINRGWLDQRATKGTTIKVLSYNILSPYLLETHKYLYTKNKERYLSWDYRSEALIREFAEYDADVLCLQEVEASKLDFFNENLTRMGYTGKFKKRTGDKVDGCAIYFRESKFELKEFVSVEYYQPNVYCLNRDNIGMIALLKPKDNPSKTIVIATTHLLFNPRRHDVKLAQVQLMLAEIERVAFKYRKNGQNFYHPIVLTGDFNLKPFTSVYNLLVNGRINLMGENPVPDYLGISTECQHREVISNRYPECREDCDFGRVQLYNTERKHQPKPMPQNQSQELSWRRRDTWLSHNLNLNSVYPHFEEGVKPVTTRQDELCTVDYIFYGPVKYVEGRRTDDEMKLISCMKLPYERDMDVIKEIPNEVCASDHFPLVATFHLPIQNH